MVSILLAMLVILALAGLVVVYVAYPHRGAEVPHTPWVGRLLQDGVRRLPTLDNQRGREQAPAPRRERASAGSRAAR